VAGADATGACEGRGTLAAVWGALAVGGATGAVATGGGWGTAGEGVGAATGGAGVDDGVGALSTGRGASTVGSGFGCGLGNGFGASTLGGSGFTSSTFAGGVAALRGAKVADRICAGVEDLPPSRMPGSRNSKPACSRMDAARHDARARWCESTSSRTNGETRACMGLLWYRQVLPLRIRPVLLPRERWQSSPLEQFIGGTVHWRLLVRRLMLGAGAKPAGTYRPQGQNPAKAM